MEILFTFELRDNQREDLESKYPQISFRYIKQPEAQDLETATVLVTYGEDIDAEKLNQLRLGVITSRF